MVDDTKEARIARARRIHEAADQVVSGKREGKETNTGPKSPRDLIHDEMRKDEVRKDEARKDEARKRDRDK